MRTQSIPPYGHALVTTAFREDAKKHPSIAVPGLSLSLEKILGKVASGSIELSIDERRIIYEQPDKHIADWSPDVREMTLAEVAEVRRNLTAESEKLRKRIHDDDEAAKRLQEIEKETKLREKILKEMETKSPQLFDQK